MAARYHKSTGEFVIECDDCGDSETYEVDSWADGLYDAKADGWRVIKVWDGWEARCPDCVEAWKQEQRENR